MATSEKRNKPTTVSDLFLLNLAGKLRKEWLDLARYLEVSDSNLHNIKSDNAGNTKEAKYQMLISWKQANGQDATHANLAGALLKAKRKDLSEKVKQEDNRTRKRSVENEFCFEQAGSSKRLRTIQEPSGNQPVAGDEDIAAGMKRKKTQLVKELRKKYRNLCGGIQPVPFLRDKYDVDELFVESGVEFLEGKPRRGKEEEKWAGLKNYKMIFTDSRIKSNRRIIDAEPGYGKSTLALQITHDWCHETSSMNDVEILILLRLRQFKNVPTIYSGIKNFLLPKDSKLTENDIEFILDTWSTVILLDGYDEYPGRGKEDTLVELIVREDMCQEYDVILTTRTSCLPPDYSRDTKRIRLTGYNDDARDEYILKVVAGGSVEDAERIKQFFRDNPIPDEIATNPLFFAMISFMVHLQERFLNLRTVTDYFRHIIKCFYTHKQIKATQGKLQKKGDHSALDKITFEGLCKDSQQISWGKDELKRKIGTKLYNEYIRIGLLIEEDGYDYDAMEYKTETVFYHKLFVEWYAAHYVVKETAEGTEFEPWPDNMLEEPHQAAGSLQRKKRRKRSQGLRQIRSLNPSDVHYMYRYACGLNRDVALKIIEHMSKGAYYDEYTLLCITEWGGSFDEIANTATLLCSRGIRFYASNSVLLQKSTLELIKFASNRKIPIDTVELYNCLSVGSRGNLSLKPSNLSLPVINTSLWSLEVHEMDREITEEETDSILQYSAKCTELIKLSFLFCLLPPCIKLTETVSVLRSRDVTVGWEPPGLDDEYLLDLDSGRWLNVTDDSPMNDEGYETVVKTVRENEEEMMQYEQELSTSSSNEFSHSWDDP